MPSAHSTPEDRYRRKPRCRTCRHRLHEGRHCKDYQCACGDTATVPDTYPFDIPNGDAESEQVLLLRQPGDNVSYLASVPNTEKRKLMLRLFQQPGGPWVATARDFLGLDIATRHASPHRALSTLHRCMRGCGAWAHEYGFNLRATRDPVA